MKLRISKEFVLTLSGARSGLAAGPRRRRAEEVQIESLGPRLESKSNSGTLDRLLTCLSPPDRLLHPLHATPVAFCMLPCLSPVDVRLSFVASGRGERAPRVRHGRGGRVGGAGDARAKESLE